MNVLKKDIYEKVFETSINAGELFFVQMTPHYKGNVFSFILDFDNLNKQRKKVTSKPTRNIL